MTEAFKVGQKIATDLENDESNEAKNGFGDIETVLKEKNIRFVSFNDWRKIDQKEKEKGEPSGKPREKFTNVNEMMSQLE